MNQITFSVLSSISYWLVKHYYPEHNPHKLSLKTITKFFAIILLLDSTKLSIYNSIVFSYMLGDVTLLYSQYIAVHFFFIGHMIFLWNLMTLKILFFTLATSAIWIYTSLFFKDILLLDGMIYLTYIGSLHLYFVIPLLYGYYGQILFITSDVGKGFIKKYPFMDKLTWPLYYFSMLYMKYWFDFYF